MDAISAFINSITPMGWAIGFIVLLLLAVGFQLNRIERQNEGLYSMIRDLLDKR